jgi:hypothetical protein
LGVIVRNDDASSGLPSIAALACHLNEGTTQGGTPE